MRITGDWRGKNDKYDPGTVAENVDYCARYWTEPLEGTEFSQTFHNLFWFHQSHMLLESRECFVINGLWGYSKTKGVEFPCEIYNAAYNILWSPIIEWAKPDEIHLCGKGWTELVPQWVLENLGKDALLKTLCHPSSRRWL
jgi:hypothetical protein